LTLTIWISVGGEEQWYCMGSSWL